MTIDKVLNLIKSSPCSDEVSREHYYLQLRENIAARGGTMEDVNHQNVLQLVALGLQADLGDHTADTNISSELLEKYLPSKVSLFVKTHFFCVYFARSQRKPTLGHLRDKALRL